MNTQKIEIEIPVNILATMNKTQDEFIQQMKTFTAVNLYLSNEISLEMAAEFSGKSKWDFEGFLSKVEIPISLIHFNDYQKEMDIIANL
jgi:predicted HTH domain antitoxin